MSNVYIDVFTQFSIRVLMSKIIIFAYKYIQSINQQAYTHARLCTVFVCESEWKLCVCDNHKFVQMTSFSAFSVERSSTAAYTAPFFFLFPIERIEWLSFALFFPIGKWRNKSTIGLWKSFKCGFFRCFVGIQTISITNVSCELTLNKSSYTMVVMLDFSIYFTFFM